MLCIFWFVLLLFGCSRINVELGLNEKNKGGIRATLIRVYKEHNANQYPTLFGDEIWSSSKFCNWTNLHPPIEKGTRRIILARSPYRKNKFHTCTDYPIFCSVYVHYSLFLAVWLGLKYLLWSKEQVLPEGEPQDIKVLPAIAECSKYMCKHFAVLQVLRVHQYHTICTPTPYHHSSQFTTFYNNL